MEQVYYIGEGKWESWDDFVQRMIFECQHGLVTCRNWDFDEVTGGISEFISEEASIRAKEVFLELTKTKLIT